MNALAINPPNHLRQNDGGVAADYHAHDKTLATREDIAELRAEIAELRREMNTGFQRLFIGLIIAIIGEFVGFGLIIAKLYFGS